MRHKLIEVTSSIFSFLEREKVIRQSCEGCGEFVVWCWIGKYWTEEKNNRTNKVECLVYLQYVNKVMSEVNVSKK